ncbi:MAG: transporter substrate-binding domain-containing protein [Streptococcaceae bacterium]|jgi:polar amino acid transport system substrate-binding protein|nr:transporter substrate-binding domain-containing protein [Streptococcaceae bacterium]
MSKRKCFVLLAVMGLACLILTACTQTSNSPLQKIQAKKELIVATAAVNPYPPFEFQKVIDGKNQIVGSDIDLANEIGKELGVKVKIENMDFNNVLTSVQSGKADIAIAALSKTAAREKSFDFSTIYFQDGNVLVVKKSNLATYTSVESLSGKQIAAPVGTIQENVVKTQFKNSVDVGLQDSSSSFIEAQTGKVAAACVDEVVGEQFVAANPDMAIAKIKVSDEGASGFAVAMPKNSGTLKTKINSIIARLQAKGTLNQWVQNNIKLSTEK